jgi:hypothetical protein
VRRIGAIAIVMSFVVAACGSGPSPEALERNERPSTTTTTEPPPEGVYTIVIENGKFTPANNRFSIDDFWIVRFENQDPPREHVVETRRGEFESPVLQPGDSWEFDLLTLDDPETEENEAEDLIRYQMFIGQQRVPGIIDTRPER